MSNDESSSIHTPIMTSAPAAGGMLDAFSRGYPHAFTDLPVIPQDYLHELEDRYPALADATRTLFYLRNPANSHAIAKRERRRMRLFLPPLKDTIEAAYKSAFWTAYNDDNAAIPIRQTYSDLMFVM